MTSERAVEALSTAEETTLRSLTVDDWPPDREHFLDRLWVTLDAARAATPAPREPKYVSLDDAGPGFLRRNPDYQGEDIIESVPVPREDGWEDEIDMAACEALGEAIERVPWPPVPAAAIAETRTGHGAVIAADLYRHGYVIRLAATPPRQEPAIDVERWAIQALPRYSMDPFGDGRQTWVPLAGVEAALRARQEPAIDVERLAAILDDFDNPALGPYERAVAIVDRLGSE